MDPLTTLVSPPPPPPAPATFQPTGAGANFNNNVSPSVLLIIIILAIIFFISGLLHLLVRFLVKPSLNYIRDPDEFDNVTALQGQLQQLFTLHDSGVDQSFIDSLPVFTYKSIIGVNNPFDCAVCLCEFESDDNLRLLPKCSHAFHMDCIDTWLLSHSTCPLCRSNLILDYPSNTCFSPVVLVLESGTGDSFRENSVDPTNDNTIQRVCSQFSVDEEFENSIPNEVKEEESKEKVVRVKLGKFKNVDGVRGDADDEKGRIDGRRCFSMGSFEYVMDDDSSLQLPIRKQFKKLSNKKMNLPITPGHRPAMSECGGDSRRDFKGFEGYTTGSGGSLRRESFSVSKIWLRGKKEKPNPTVVASTNIEQPSSTRTFSLQFLLHQNRAGDNDTKVSEMGCDDLEIQNDHNLDQQEAVSSSNQQSFAKRSLLWLMGRRKNKVVHSSMSTNV